MGEYEIRILDGRFKPSLIFEDFHPNDSAAIAKAKRIAGGKGFEVWRGLDCIAAVRLRLIASAHVAGQ